MKGVSVGDLSHEPSMEEILSSIKRIIAEDSDAAMASPRIRRSVGALAGSAAAPAYSAPADEPEVLELTDPLAEPPVSIAPQPEIAPVQPEIAPVVATQPVAAPPVAAPPEPKPALVSPSTVEASRTSLAALSALIVKPEVPGSDTLEGLVREMIRPILAEWLDARLPDIVDRMVAQEIARITARD